MSSFSKIVITDDEHEKFLRRVQEQNPNAPDYDTNPIALQSYAKAKYGGQYAFTEKNTFEHLKLDTYNDIVPESERDNDVSPSFFGDAWKAGANHSVTGLAKKIVLGNDLSNGIYGGKVSENYDPGLAQGTIEFVSSLVHDIPFFWATGGLGLTTAVAGGVAKKEAAKQISRYMFKDTLKENAFNTISKKAINSTIKKNMSKSAIKKELLKKTDDAVDIATINRLHSASLSNSKKTLKTMLSSPEMMSHGIKKTLTIGGKKHVVEVGAPGMRRIFAMGGLPMANQLALHGGTAAALQEVVNNIAEKINPETGQPFGQDLAQSIFSRFKETGQGFGEAFTTDDIQNVIMAAGEGWIGGFMAGGFSSLSRASRVGALDRMKNYETFMSKPVRSSVVKAITNQRADLPIEAGIFTLSHKAGSAFRKATDFAYDEELAEHEDGWGKTFVKNLVQFKGMRVVNQAKAKAKQIGNKAYLEYIGKASERKINQDKKTKKDFENIKAEGETKADKIINETLEQVKGERTKSTEGLEVKGAKLFQQMVEMNAKQDWGGKKHAEFEKLYDKFQKEIIETTLKEDNVLSPTLEQFNREINTIKENIPLVIEKISSERIKAEDAKLKEMQERAAKEKEDSKPVKEMTKKELVEGVKEGTIKAQENSFENIVIDAQSRLKGKKNAEVLETINNSETHSSSKLNKENKDVLTAVAALSGESTKSQIPLYKRFAGWLADNRGSVSLRNFTGKDAQEFINDIVGNATYAAHMQRLMKFTQGKAISKNILSASEMKVREAETFKPKKVVTLEPKELASFDTSINNTAKIGGQNTKGTDRGRVVEGTMKINKSTYMHNEAVQLISHLIGHHGSRQVAIVGGKAKSQPGILIKDVEFSRSNKPGESYALIKTREKGYNKAKSKDKPLFEKTIRVEDIAELNGVNYFKVLDALITKRQIESTNAKLTTSQHGNQKLLEVHSSTTGKTPSKAGKLTRTHIQTILNNFVGVEGLTPHRFRHSLTQGSVLVDAMLGGKSQDYFNFAKRYFLNHVDASSATARYLEKNGGVNPKIANEIRREIEKAFRTNKNLKLTEKTENAVSEFMRQIGDEAAVGKKKGQTTQKSLDLIDSKGNRTNEQSLKNRFNEWESKNPTLKGKIKEIEAKEGNFKAQFRDGVVELVAGKATAKEFFHENIHNIERYVRALGDKKLTALFDRGIKLAKQYGMSNDKANYTRTVEAYKKDIQAERAKAGQKPLSRKQLEIEANREYLTELGAVWANRYDSAKGFQKLRMWGESFASSIKAFFGKAGLPEIVSIIGKKAQVGYNPNANFKVSLDAINKSMQGRMKSLDMADAFPLTRDTKKQIEKHVKRIGLTEEQFRTALVTAKLPKELALGNMSEVEGIQLTNLLSSVKSVSKGKFKREPSWNALNGQAHLLEKVKDITPTQKNAIGEALGLIKPKGKNVSLGTASEQQLKSYIHFLSKLESRDNVTQKIFSDRAMQEMNDMYKNKSTFKKLKLLAQMALLPGDVMLRKLIPGKRGERLADKFLDHFQTEAAYFGYGQYQIMKSMEHVVAYAKNNTRAGIAGGIHAKKISDLIAFTLDPSLAKDIKFKNWEQRFLDRAEIKGTNAYKAKKSIQKMFDKMYENLFMEARGVLNKREFDTFRREYSKKFVNQYYTRVYTDEAREHFSLGGDGREQFVKQIKNDIVKQGMKQTFGVKIEALREKLANARTESSRKSINEQIAKLKVRQAEEVNILMDAKTQRGKKIENEASTLAMQLLEKPNYSIRNKFLLKRMPKMENTFIDVNGKEQRTYKTDFEKVTGRYIRTMSGFLATVKHFNEFSDIKGEFSTGRTARDILKQLETDSYAGNYALTMLKSRLGMNRTGAMESLGNDVLGSATKYSAILGLSSPMSGLKNLVIGSAMTAGTFGVSPFLAGMSMSMKPEFRDYVTKLGGREVGAKELELTGFGKWWMDNISKMTGSEAVNRFVSVGAGKMTAQGLGDVLSGRKQSIFKTRESEAIAQLKGLFNLKDKDIAFIRNYGLTEGAHGIKGKQGKNIDREIKKMMDKVAHYSHIKTQGATAEPFLPIWMQSGVGRSLTLFYRMAYSGTHNIYNNMIKPATRGNVLPIVRYGIAGNAMGSALWSIYAMLFGQENPKALSDDLKTRVFSNFSKAETLGLFGYLVNPYSSTGDSKGLASYVMGSGDAILQPAIIRNAAVVSQLTMETLNAITGNRNAKRTIGKGLEQSVRDMGVVFNHSHRFFRKNFSENVKPTYDALRSAKKLWMEESGWREKEGYAEGFSYTHEKSRYYDYVKEAFYSGNTESAAQYIEALYYYLYDQHRFVGGQTMKSHRHAEKAAEQQINSLLKNLNPINLEDAGLGNVTLASKKREYLKWLKNRDADMHEKAVKMEKQYHYTMRKIKSARRKYRQKYRENYYEDGKIFSDGMMFAPRGTLMGFGYSFKEYTRQSNMMKSDLRRLKTTK